MNGVIHREIRKLAFVGVVMGSVLCMASQAQEPVMSMSGGGSQYDILDDTNVSWERSGGEDSIIVLTYAGSGEGVAKLRITRGTEVSLVQGRKISLRTDTGTFIIEGNARVERGKDILAGTKSLTFDGEKGTLIVEGTVEKPAEVSFYSGKTHIQGKAPRWLGTFKNKGSKEDRDWELQKFSSDGAVSDGRVTMPEGSAGAPIIIDGLSAPASGKPADKPASKPESDIPERKVSK